MTHLAIYTEAEKKRRRRAEKAQLRAWAKEIQSYIWVEDLSADKPSGAQVGGAGFRHGPCGGSMRSHSQMTLCMTACDMLQEHMSSSCSNALLPSSRLVSRAVGSASGASHAAAENPATTVRISGLAVS